MGYKIARKGKYELRRITNINKDYVYTTHEIEIVCYDVVFQFCFTVASFNDKGELVSSNILDSIITIDDLEDVKSLVKIATLIIKETDNVEIQ